MKEKKTLNKSFTIINGIKLYNTKYFENIPDEYVIEPSLQEKKGTP